MIKRLRLLALTLFLCVSAGFCKVYAAKEAKPAHGMSLEIGADVVSSYLWRGQHLGGLSVQPSVTFDWKGLYISGWGNIGADNWMFTYLNPELDITIGYDNYGLKLDLTHLYYFGGSKYFKGLNDPNNAFGYSTMELHAGLDMGEWFRIVPLTVDWYTTVLGYDPVLDEMGKPVINANGNAERAYSTYIELGYTFDLWLGINLGLKVGFTPWQGMYSDYQAVWQDGSTVGINNIQLRAERDFKLGGLELNVWGEARFNCYGANKYNIIKTLIEADSQKLNGCVGVGIYLGNEW